MGNPRHQEREAIGEGIHEMRCGICGSQRVELRHSRYGYYYRCPECGAMVGCHRGTKKPMGMTMDDEGRRLRKECHQMFDELWTTSKERSERYRTLASMMNIRPSQCHFAKMTKRQLIQARDCIRLMLGYHD